jgi:hypothetical protein
MGYKHPGVHTDPAKKKLWAQRSWDERIAQHFRAHELPLVAKEVILNHEVFIGVHKEKFFDEPKEYPSGYYKTAFAVLRGKTVPIQVLEFDGNHDPLLTDNMKLQARVNKTIREAINSIELGREGGFYEK